MENTKNNIINQPIKETTTRVLIRQMTQLTYINTMRGDRIKCVMRKKTITVTYYSFYWLFCIFTFLSK